LKLGASFGVAKRLDFVFYWITHIIAVPLANQKTTRVGVSSMGSHLLV
jgi:hypothetical protein